jgi:hypothetical protein
MTPPKPSQNRREYQRHGLRALQGALKAVGDREGWLESLGEVGDALKAGGPIWWPISAAGRDGGHS